MNLCSGTLSFDSSTVSEFITLSQSFDNTGIVGVICDNAEDAINFETVPGQTLGGDLVNANNNIVIFNADTDTIIYDFLEAGKISVYTDKIYDYLWRRFLENLNTTHPLSAKYTNFERNVLPIMNAEGPMNYQFTRKMFNLTGMIAVMFKSLPKRIDCVSASGVEIINDYTYNISNATNRRHIELKRDLHKYYIFDMESELIYDFKTYPNLAMGGAF